MDLRKSIIRNEEVSINIFENEYKINNKTPKQRVKRVDGNDTRLCLCHE